MELIIEVELIIREDPDGKNENIAKAPSHRAIKEQNTRQDTYKNGRSDQGKGP